ncbi:MAG TPA: flagellar biosynthesis anti-sigma factor FlgM [Acidisarcina sp.]
MARYFSGSTLLMMDSGGADIRPEAQDKFEKDPDRVLAGPVLPRPQSSQPPLVPREGAVSGSSAMEAARTESDWKAMMTLRLAGEALALPDIRLDKIAIVQSALANGSYRIRTWELASKVMDSMVESMLRDTPRSTQ